MVVLILVEVKIPRPSNTFQTNFKVSGVTEPRWFHMANGEVRCLSVFCFLKTAHKPLCQSKCLDGCRSGGRFWGRGERLGFFRCRDTRKGGSGHSE